MRAQSVFSASDSFIVSSEIREELSQRASMLESGSDICRTIFHTLAEKGVDARRVSLDEMKNLVVVAVRAFRAHNSAVAA